MATAFEETTGAIRRLAAALPGGTDRLADCVVPSFTNPNNLSIVTGVPPFDGPTAQDQRIVNLVVERTKGMVLVANKMDLVPKRDRQQVGQEEITPGQVGVVGRGFANNVPKTGRGAPFDQ